MRRELIVAAAALLTACASASPPPGGPEDKLPPRVVKVTPDTNSVNVHPDNVSFQFDEVINDRGTGEQEVDRYFLVSPSDGAPHVSWHRSRIDVRPRRGFQNGIAYTVTLLPGLTDLHGNRMKAGQTLVFSTGANIPPYRITGTVFDWVGERAAPQALVEAFIPGPDSVRYLAQTDSVGKFTLGPMPAGTYLLRAYIDLNNNRAMDRAEAFDTARVMVPTAGALEILTAVRDTLPTRIQSVTTTDSLTLTVTFDRAIDPTVPLSVAQFTLKGPDSAVVPIRSAASPRMERTADSLARKAAADSARRADSLAGKPLPATPPVSAVPALPGGRPAPPPPARPSVPAPYTTVTLKLQKALAPNTLYRLSVSGLRALSRREQASERTFTTPRPAPPKAVKDSTATKPATPPATPPPTRPPTRS